MKKYTIIGLILIALAVGSLFVVNYYQNQQRLEKIYSQIETTSEYESLSKELESWCDRFYFSKPRLHLRLNHSLEGYYSQGILTLLTPLEVFLTDKEVLRGIMAHEFGHYYLSIRHPELDPKAQELFADIVAKDMVGIDLVKKTLSKGINRQEDSVHLPYESRLIFLEKYKDKKIIEDRN